MVNKHLPYLTILILNIVYKKFHQNKEWYGRLATKLMQYLIYLILFMIQMCMYAQKVKQRSHLDSFKHYNTVWKYHKL